MRSVQRAVVTGYVCLSASAFAGRPLTVDDADPVGVRQFEFEVGTGYFRDSLCRHWDVPIGLTCGLAPDVEIGAGFGGQFEKRSEIFGEGRGLRHVHENGIGDLFIGSKWQLVRETGWCPRLALAPSVKIPTADEDDGMGSGETDYDLTWIASKALTARAGAHVNAGYSFIGEPSCEDLGDVVHYGVALDYQLADPLQWVGEVFAEKALENGGGTAIQYNTGVRWCLSDTLIFDLAAGSRICGDGTPDITATAGLTWAFGLSERDNND